MEFFLNHGLIPFVDNEPILKYKTMYKQSFDKLSPIEVSCQQIRGGAVCVNNTDVRGRGPKFLLSYFVSGPRN